MEIVKSRYGLDRTVEKIGSDRLRVMGETQFSRQAQNDAGEITCLISKEVLVYQLVVILLTKR